MCIRDRQRRAKITDEKRKNRSLYGIEGKDRKEDKKKRVYQNLNSLAVCFFLDTDYTENTDFLCSFSVKSV